MKFSMKNNKGFSLVELMIVVGIIGILATIAMPKMQTFMAKAKQSEVKTNLAHMYTLELAYFGDFSTYGDATAIGFASPAGVKYTYSVSNVTAATFLAQGTVGPDVLCKGASTDTWTMNESQVLSNTVKFGSCN